MARYNFREAEARWQNTGANATTFQVETDPSRPKYYLLEMFPYPSGKLHVGHVRNYTMGDMVARYKRARGYNVLHPMGWDAFGLPAENAAIAGKVHPAEWTYGNIATMREQLKRMGLAYDWSREIATCHPEYYRHEQKMFLDFLRTGLAYRKESWVNWDPVENTVLANEQVIDGRGWRSGALVEKRLLSQWFLRITHYAEDLLAALKTLERWPERVRLMQENWIGRSQGARVFFGLKGRNDRLEIFTTRPDTLFGASFCAISPNHPLATELAGQDPKLAEFIAECNRMGTSEAILETAEKKGVDTGVKVLHPLVKDWELPLYVANFVLMEYGSGAIFGCPAHDQRDLDFARKYQLAVRPVVLPPGETPESFAVGDEAYVDEGIIFNSDFLDGLAVPEAKHKVTERLEALGAGHGTIAWRLRDWGVSRQRYWGCPIPVIHCEACGIVPVPEKDLPVRLPDDVDFDKPGNPLVHHPTWKHATCPNCGGKAVRETDTFDTFFESLLVFRALLLAARRDGLRAQRRGLLDAGRPVYRRHRACGAASSLFPLLHPRAAGLRLYRRDRAVRRVVHSGHGLSRDLSRRRGSVAFSRRGPSRRHGHAGRCRKPPGHGRPHGKDEQVEKERGRARSHCRRLRRRHRAALSPVRQSARARSRMDRCRHRRRLALRQSRCIA